MFHTFVCFIVDRSKKQYIVNFFYLFLETKEGVLHFENIFLKLAY